MSLSKELKDLKKQKRHEVRKLHGTYIRTKREVKRAVSPDRMIRRHIGVSLAVAAVVGLLLAPRSGAAPAEKAVAGGKKRSFVPSWLRGIIKKIAPQLEDYLPEEPPPSPADEAVEAHEEAVDAAKRAKKAARKAAKKALNPLTPMIIQILMAVLKKIDLQKAIAQIMHVAKGPADGEAAQGEASVAVGNTGTVSGRPPTVG